MKSLTKLIFLAGLILAPVLNAQPVSGWKHYYPNGGGGFNDLYACAGGDLVMCGYNEGPCLARLSREGDEVWSVNVENGMGGIALTIIEADNGDLMMGGQFSNEFTVFRFRANGQQIWRRSYGTGCCNAIIELKGGNFAIAGFSPELARSRARLIIIDGDGGQVMLRDYEHGRMPQFWCLREVDNGLVLLGNTYSGGLYRSWLTKVDFEGNPDWTVDYNQDFIHASSWNALVTTGDGGYLLQMFTLQNGPWLNGFMKVDNRGQVVWTAPFRDLTIYAAPGVVHVPDVGFIGVMGLQSGLPAAICIDNEGHEQWRATYRADRNDDFTPSILRSVVLGADGHAYAAGDAVNANGSPRGFVMCLGGVDWSPEIFRWSPLDTMQTVLLGDSMTFSVVASDPFGGGVRYEWFVADTATGVGDTTITVTFDSLGVIPVMCRVSTNRASRTITWHVRVADLLIFGYSPDSLSLAIQRGCTVQFSFDSIRVIEGEEENYAWTKTNLDNFEREDVGLDSSIAVSFPRVGSYAVEGVVSRGETAFSVVWNVAVRSCILDYFPVENILTVPQDSIVSFEVLPFNNEPGMTNYRWSYGDEEMGGDTSRTDIIFTEPGEFDIGVLVNDDFSSDTLHWQVTVTPVNGISSRTDGRLPCALAVSSSPNPFNATTTVKIAMPLDGEVSIALFDVRGRQVGHTLQTRLAAGFHRRELGGLTSVNVGGLDSGIYFLKVKSIEASVVKKLVLNR